MAPKQQKLGRKSARTRGSPPPISSSARTSMCSPASLALLDASISDSWTDSDLVQFLLERKPGDPLPQNVNQHVDLSSVDPWDLYGETWYLNWLDHRQLYEFDIRKGKSGYWKPVDFVEIPTSTTIEGLKVFLHFYEGQPPLGKRTGWAMYEYQVEHEAIVPQAYKTLSRVFFQEDRRKRWIKSENQHDSLNGGSRDNQLETKERNVVPNSKNVAVNEQSVSCKGQDEQKCKRRSIKLKLIGRKFYIQKIPQVWCSCKRVSSPLSHEFRFQICEHLGQLLNAMLLDLVVLKHKINKDKNRIWKMEEKVANVNVQNLVAFSNDYGPSIRHLVEMCAHNEKALRCIKRYVNMLMQNKRTLSIADRLSSQVRAIDEENKPKQTSAFFLLDIFKKLDLRIQEEAAWIEQFGAYLQESYARITDALSEGGMIECEILQLKTKLAEFVQDKTSNHGLHEIVEAQKSIELCLENFSRQLKLTDVRIRSLESIFNSKMRYFLRCVKHQEYMSNTYSEIKPVLADISTKLLKIIQMYGLTVEEEAEPSVEESFNADEYAFQSLKMHELDLCFSWRERLFHNRRILSPVRVQSSGTCSYYATLSTVESLYKREYAAFPTILKDITGQPDEFLINLSREQLEDIVEDFKVRHKMKGSERLTICLDRMKKEGVSSEEAYCVPQIQPVEKYKIKEYEEIDLERKKLQLEDLVNSMEKCDSKTRRKKLAGRRKRKLVKDISEVIISNYLKGRVMIANFRITTEYFRLLPHEIYRIPGRKARYEVNKAGVPVSHCVVVVGFGVRNGQVYLIYQNSYGTSWGLGGFGRIYLDSVRLLYLAHV